MADEIAVVDSGRLLRFTFADLLAYHGPGSPGGVAHAFRAMQRAWPLLDALETLKGEMAERVMAAPAAEVYDASCER